MSKHTLHLLFNKETRYFVQKIFLKKVAYYYLFAKKKRDLWRKVIVTKFIEFYPCCSNIVSDPDGMEIWRIIRNLWPLMEANHSLKIGNGNKTKF